MRAPTGTPTGAPTHVNSLSIGSQILSIFMIPLVTCASILAVDNLWITLNKTPQEPVARHI